MLDLSSPVWEELHGPFGSAKAVPVLLQQLQEDYTSEVKDELYWEHLFHQDTIYSITFAALPYLSQLARQSDNPEVKLDIYATCGIFVTNQLTVHSGNLPAEFDHQNPPLVEELVQEIYTAYLTAVKHLGNLSEEIFRYAEAAQKDDQEKRYILAADAAYRGDRAVAGILLTYSEGDEYMVGCPSCYEEMYIWPNENSPGMTAYSDDPVFNGKENGQAVTPSELGSTRQEDSPLVRLWQAAHTIKNSQLLEQLPYLSGHVYCPTCGGALDIWPELLPL
ncbi:hypothetical protein C162_12411 [Paenibacillus sp. FSL R7-269]|uniref:hypothetical protein n=1 Tax=Paenibacillus sp. FSL R7-269 TaxID=1226755 RepID=UPI0003E2462E|nr:hypothetical protein [Paenibacillus sp. FSL R7-269]ETT50039.1 hypothetical protein C162_12411 [Paenibacillus sp. FSL R7-269]